MVRMQCTRISAKALQEEDSRLWHSLCCGTRISSLSEAIGEAILASDSVIIGSCLHVSIENEEGAYALTGCVKSSFSARR